MDASLGLEITIGVTPLHLDRRRLDTGFVAWLQVHHLRHEITPFEPALVETHQHLGPVGGLGTTRTGVDLEDGVRGVVLVGQHREELHLVEFAGDFRRLELELGQRLLVLLSHTHLVQLTEIGQASLQRIERLDDGAQCARLT